jgi:membrane fusion protein (multidrug efflux system)
MIKRFLIAIVLLAIVVGGIVGFNMFRDQAIQQFFANMPQPTLAVSTVEVKPAPWTPGIEAIGTVLAARGVDLTVETTGIVKEILFSANEKIEQNQVLVQLDDAIQKADLAAAQAQAALDQTSLDRALELQRRRVGSDVTVESARAAATSSQARVTSLQAVLDQKQIRAPFAGTIGIPRIDPGQYLAPGTIVATLQDMETMRVDFSVPEQQLGLLKMDQTVRLGFDPRSWQFEGRITGIDPKVDPATRLVAVRAEVSNPDGRLSPGQFVRVRVELPVEDDIVAIPQTSVVTSLYGDYVYVVRPTDAQPAPAAQEPPATSSAPEAATPANAAPQADAAPAEGDKAAETAAPAQGEQPAGPALTARQVFVTTGRRSEGLVEVVRGLDGGETIVTAGQNRLSNGSSVRIDNTVTPETTAAAQ